jgi:MarR family transcriptional regulator, 2-MHQ and catechol-resistance regulon repressor
MIQDPNQAETANAPSPERPDEPRRGKAGTGQEDALRLWVVLARTYQTLVRAVGNRGGDDGLTLSQFGILEALYHLGPCSLGELAEKLLVTGGNVTYVMDRLEEQGLVYRKRSDLDRRVVEARLTEAGELLIERLFPVHADHLGALMNDLEPAEQRALRQLLKRLGQGVAAKTRPAATPASPPPYR